METKQRTGWATALVVLSVVVGALFVLFLVMTAIPLFD
jgi:hypothetical protein